MMKIKKDDIVRVISGKDRDKEGKVLSVSQKNNTVVVEGVNMRTKHMKQNGQDQGGIVKTEGPIDASKVMLVSDGKITRVGFEIKDGKKVRVAKATGKVID